MLEQAYFILKKTGVDKLPSLPHVLLKLLNVLNQETEDFKQLAYLIRQDPALYTRFLFISHLSKNKYRCCVSNIRTIFIEHGHRYD